MDEAKIEKVKQAFPNKAWVYEESHEGVKIGKWENGSFVFHDGLKFYDDINEAYLLTLRVFDKQRELKFTKNGYRDTSVYSIEKGYIEDLELTDAKYYMYGEHHEPLDGFSKLWESRGGSLVFPVKLQFPFKDNEGKELVRLMLGIRNFVRFNPVEILPKNSDKEAAKKLFNPSGAGALEVVDYAYTGFFYDDGKEVEP